MRNKLGAQLWSDLHATPYECLTMNEHQVMLDTVYSMDMLESFVKLNKR